MKIICVTGGIATGKTSVLNLLNTKYITYNSDLIARKIFEKNENIIIEKLGNDILREGKICKEKVKKLIFNNKEARKILERIIHPQVYKYLTVEILKCFFMNHSLVFVEIPLFFELGLNKYFDCIVVYTSEKIQIERLKNRDGNSSSIKAIEIQLDIEEKRRQARWVIDNSKSPEYTKLQLEKIHFGGNNILSYVYIFILVFLMYIV